jgi:hypothetical protein
MLIPDHQILVLCLCPVLTLIRHMSKIIYQWDYIQHHNLAYFTHEVNHSTWLLKLDISILRYKCSEEHPLSSVQNKELFAVTKTISRQSGT